MAAPMVHVENDEESASNEFSDEASENDDISSGSDDESDVVEQNYEEDGVKKSGLANVMAKILQKSISKDCSVLAKGLTDKQISKKRKTKTSGDDKSKPKKEKSTRDGSSSDENDSSDDEDDNRNTGIKSDPLRVKPDPLQKENERVLQRTATKGVVQLFNAVQKQQKIMDEKVNATNSEVKKDKALKTITKGGFMDMLKPVDKIKQVTTPAIDNEPSWKILRDDFMMGAKLKDWDKESDDGGDSDDNS